MALERDLSTLLSLSSSLSSILLALTEAVWADLFPPAPYFFSCVVDVDVRGGRNESHMMKMYINVYGFISSAFGHKVTASCSRFQFIIH